jgi:hypothetical protein
MQPSNASTTQPGVPLHSLFRTARLLTQQNVHYSNLWRINPASLVNYSNAASNFSMLGLE